MIKGNKRKTRIVFMGTPEFAVASLDALVKKDYNVVGVITAVDKPAGRGRKLQQSPVKKYALKHDIKVLQPRNLKGPIFQRKLKKLKADIQVVVAFRMLPESVFDPGQAGARMATFNLHASLLPQYRGAAPINWAIINGEKVTGLTTFLIQKKIDTGNILLQEQVSFGKDETAGELHDRLMAKGAELVVKTVEGLIKGSLEPKEQEIDGLNLKAAPKIYREDCEINWNQDAVKVYNFIRGLSPYPAAWTKLNGKTLKIYRASIEDLIHELEVGDYCSDGKKILGFAARGGLIKCEEVQLDGKKRMATEEFLRGYKVNQ